MIKFLLFLFFTATVLSLGSVAIKKSAQVPEPTNGRLPIGAPFTGYNTTHHTAYGTYTEYITTYDTAGTAPYEIIVVPGVGFLLDGGPALGGIQWTLQNGSYIYFDMPSGFVGCWYSFTGTFDYEITVFKTVVKIGEQGIFDWYFGYTNDFGGCGMGVAIQFLVNPFDNTLWQISYTYLTPLPEGAPDIPTTLTGAFVTSSVVVGHGSIPPLPELCWGMNYSDPNTNFCYFWHYGLPCTGFGNNECQSIPGPYIPQ